MVVGVECILTIFIIKNVLKKKSHVITGTTIVIMNTHRPIGELLYQQCLLGGVLHPHYTPTVFAVSVLYCSWPNMYLLFVKQRFKL